MADLHDQLSRRLFAAHLAALTAGCALPRIARGQEQAQPQRPRPPVQIAGLTVRTSQPLKVMRAFYGQMIGFPVAAESERSITFKTGAGTLTFQHTPDVDAFYHFAFNIPENQIESAHDWQAKRDAPLILPPARLNDPGHPRGIVAFRHWNAHSVFFWDPAGNAVEYIARHDLKNAREGEFSLDSILHISEIGLVVDDVPAAATIVRQSLDAKTYVSASDAFEPVGDQHGLLIMMKRGQPMAFDQGGRRDVFPTEVRLKDARAERVGIEGYPYVLVGGKD